MYCLFTTVLHIPIDIYCHVCLWFQSHVMAYCIEYSDNIRIVSYIHAVTSLNAFVSFKVDDNVFILLYVIPIDTAIDD